MEDKPKERIIERLENRKAELLYQLCEDERIYIPEVIAQTVFEIREITRILKFLKEEE
jgi:hypothetical protein